MTKQGMVRQDLEEKRAVNRQSHQRYVEALAHGYSILDRLSEELGLNFIEHVIPITVGASACMRPTANECTLARDKH